MASFCVRGSFFSNNVGSRGKKNFYINSETKAEFAIFSVIIENQDGYEKYVSSFLKKKWLKENDIHSTKNLKMNLSVVVFVSH